ncbi:hypothetical protein VDQ65_19905, partial [Xanthomonas campestris pv. campestris]|nr:hypothetical protein [Xanthomonas campestris pv. campestris]
SSGTPLQTSRPCGRWVIGGFSGATKERLISAYSNQDFLDSTGPGANTIPKLEQRIKVVSNYFVPK